MAGTTDTTAGWMQIAPTFTPLHGVMSQVIPWKCHVVWILLFVLLLFKDGLKTISVLFFRVIVGVLELNIT